MTPTVAAFEPVQKKVERDRFVKLTRNEARRREERSNIKKAAGVTELEITNLCLILHELAQRYVPRSAQTFRDFDALTQATRALQKLGLNPALEADVCAPTKSVETAVVTNSPEYRKLRNRFIAALATIADMPEKTTPPGAPEYQRGVREGYRRASDIAILFLEDVQLGIKR